MSSQFARKARPEILEAAKAVSSVLSIDINAGSCTPKGADSEIKTLKMRLAKETYTGTKPQVVFFTCETAANASSSRSSSKTRKAPKPTQQAEISRKVYDTVFDVVAARDACVYTTYVDLTKTDISNITKDKDRFLNRETGPYMVFYKPDGTVSGYLQGRMINRSNYCREIAKLIGSPMDSRKRLTSMTQALRELEQLVSKNYILKQQYAKAQAEANQRRAKSKTSRASGSKGKSNAQKMADAIQTKLQSSDEQIASVKQTLSSLSSTPISK